MYIDEDHPKVSNTAVLSDAPGVAVIYTVSFSISTSMD